MGFEKTSHRNIDVFAPAKINLYLHITGKRNDGYHLLDSLVVFADIGDRIIIEPAPHFSFHIQGPFAHFFHREAKPRYCDDDNLVVRAARRMADITGNPLNVSITLEKNLPVAAGLGGGSGDAAATIWALQCYWELGHHGDYLAPLLYSLGADVPVCYHGMPSLMRGIGEDLSAAPDLPEMPIVLVNPLIPCPTADVFLHYNAPFRNIITPPAQFKDVAACISFLEECNNDLGAAAHHMVADIGNVLSALSQQKGVLLHRMSGSGASCFGLFDTPENSLRAVHLIRAENPDWWVQSGYINRVSRY